MSFYVFIYLFWNFRDFLNHSEVYGEVFRGTPELDFF